MNGPPRYRRFLLDMHVPDRDAAFLADFEPRAYAGLLAEAGVDSVMLYCQSHTGLCYYPTSVGRQHAAFVGKDHLGRLLGDLRARGIEAFAYYSVIFNNEAWRDHPDWRIVPRPRLMDRDFHGERYGQVCPNNPDYLDFALSQVSEILELHAFDGFFFDMTFWPGVCACPSCTALHEAETGRPLPRVIDWNSAAWCGFQRLRERWLVEFAGRLTGAVKAKRPGLPVFHNFTLALAGWRHGMTFDLADRQDFLGGDFYGDGPDRLLVGSLMRSLSPARPIEMMTTVSEGLTDHVSLKEDGALDAHVRSAIASSAALRFIDAVDPRGTFDPATYARVGRSFAAMRRLEPFMGGEAVEEVVVYLSDHAMVNLAENGEPADSEDPGSSRLPHLEAARGALLCLQQAHLPFGVITRRELGRLDGYRLIIVPDLLRILPEEVEAFRAYVAGGGALYASGGTSLLSTEGLRSADFLLADVFGCHYQGQGPARGHALRPLHPRLAEALAPQRWLSLAALPGRADSLVRLSGDHEGRSLASLSLPYADGSEASSIHGAWSSIHSDPPWLEGDEPTVVEHRLGQGLSLFSAAPLEAKGHWSHRAVFVALVERLLEGRRLRFRATAPKDIQVTAFLQAEASRYVINLLSGGSPGRVEMRFDLGEGRLPSAVRVAPRMDPVEWRSEGPGSLTFAVDPQAALTTLCLEYA